MDKKTQSYMRSRVDKAEQLEAQIDSVDQAVHLALQVLKGKGSFYNLEANLTSVRTDNYAFNGEYSVLKIIHPVPNYNDRLVKLKQDQLLQEVLAHAIIEYGEKRLAELQEEYDKL